MTIDTADRNVTFEERLASRIVMRVELAQRQLLLAHQEAEQLADRHDLEPWDKNLIAASHAAQTINGAFVTCGTLLAWARCRRNGLRDLIHARNTGRA